jgi:uncharacterized protein with ATP-grasp and redox domains
MGHIIHKIVRKMTRTHDPYSRIKAKSNEMAVALYPRVRKKLSKSGDRLLTAVELAIAGNVIDYGVKNSLNLDEELEKLLGDEQETIKKQTKAIFDYGKFERALHGARTILYLADNAGESLFDRVLIEEMNARSPDSDIVYAVKDKPVINDALVEDARRCGVDRAARVISSGSDAPGTILSICSKEFLKIFRKSDMVISKGQGNFETLSDAERQIFFLLMAKCPVIAADLGCNVGDIILWSNR